MGDNAADLNASNIGTDSDSESDPRPGPPPPINPDQVVIRRMTRRMDPGPYVKSFALKTQM